MRWRTLQENGSTKQKQNKNKNKKNQNKKNEKKTDSLSEWVKTVRSLILKRLNVFSRSISAVLKPILLPQFKEEIVENHKSVLSSFG